MKKERSSAHANRQNEKDVKKSMNRRFIALLCVAIMLAVGFTSVVTAASPSEATSPAITTESSPASSISAGSDQPTRPAPAASVTATASPKATYISVTTSNYKPRCLDRFTIQGYLRNVDGTRLVGSQWVNLYYWNGAAWIYVTYQWVSSSGSFVFKDYYWKGISADTKQVAWKVVHPASGLEKYSSKILYQTARRINTYLTMYSGVVQVTPTTKRIRVDGYLRSEVGMLKYTQVHLHRKWFGINKCDSTFFTDANGGYRAKYVQQRNPTHTQVVFYLWGFYPGNTAYKSCQTSVRQFHVPW